MYKKKIISINATDEIKINREADFLMPELDFAEDYLERFDLDDIMQNQLTFINITNKVELSKAWNGTELQQLWRYNLHYFEYSYRLVYEYLNRDNDKKYYDKFKYFVENWIKKNPLGFGDGWHPYTVSLRLTNWISVYTVFKEQIQLDKNFADMFKESMYLQYRFLQRNLEKDVLGNHYFENIKALIIGSVFFEDITVKEKFKEELIKQLNEQILEDGMHFELSPMYHKIILEDLIKMAYWLKADSIYGDLIIYIKKMLNVTYSFEQNFGKTPAFNDSADGISKDYKSLLATCNKYFNLEPQSKNSFEDSGFYFIEDKTKKIIFDAGNICPSYLPAHGHCDALSFELSLYNNPTIVNSGTYMYKKGKWRDYFRSTKAHNTVLINDNEQSQCWSSFRVAKRIKKVRRKQFDYKKIRFLAGSYISYGGNEHKRYIGNINESKIIVLDYVKTGYKNSVKSYLHFTPGAKIEIQDNKASIIIGDNAIKVIAIGVNKIYTEKGWYSEKFNIKEENEVLCLEKNNDGKFFGYLIDLNFVNGNISEFENELRISNEKILVINYDELGDLF